jgi:NAD(P)-dependent dehydrogenase (short-subunit alcohol dehydrogenase family)
MTRSSLAVVMSRLPLPDREGALRVRLPAVRSVRSLSGASAAVTGAGRGIGRAIALDLALAGARVAVGDVDVDAAEGVAREIGSGAFAFALDVTDPDGFRAFLDEAERRHGPLALLVNSAGVDWIGPFHEGPTRSPGAKSR